MGRERWEAAKRTRTGKTRFSQVSWLSPGALVQDLPFQKREAILYSRSSWDTPFLQVAKLMAEGPENDEPGWYCIRTKPKSEHLAARNLVGFANLDEVFCPRIRYEKSTRRGKVWFVEALFPGYLFARFELSHDIRAVNAATGVLGVLRFADDYPQIENSFIEVLKGEFPEEEGAIRIIEPEIRQGDKVIVTEGPMKGLETVVTRLVSGQDRVQVLMEWLGEEREAEVSLHSLNRPGEIRTGIGPSNS